MIAGRELKFMAKAQVIKQALSYSSWPLVFGGGLVGSYFAFAGSHPIAAFLAVYASAVLSLFLLERYIPYEVEWLEGDGETMTSIGHTLLTKGLVQLAAAAAAIFPMLAANVLQPLAAMRFDLWPSHLPVIIQVALAVTIAEFGLYWAHRIAHETVFFWRFHALHHSVVRLWVVNTGRFHVADSCSRSRSARFHSISWVHRFRSSGGWVR